MANSTLQTVTVGNRSAVLDLEPEMSPHQARLLAEALAKVLVKTGALANGARLTGPHLLQFAEEFAEHS